MYVETNQGHSLTTELLCKITIEESLDLHVDPVVNDHQDSKPIFNIAKKLRHSTMTENLRLVARQLAYLQRMGKYLAHSIGRCNAILPVADWKSLSLEEHEALAAFRIRFGEFQDVGDAEDPKP